MGVHFVTDRKNRIAKHFFNRPNTLKLSSLFSKKKPETIRKLCKLIDIINKKISSPWKKNPQNLDTVILESRVDIQLTNSYNPCYKKRVFVSLVV
jgi:hypothetical protein